ncbi:bifunctional nuclease family protein [Ruania halotolerans]|uniref:bifunctional nuclease family protein n=1 Tax=Ruania halotolerans TaxID=2897773 RepID=UPI001E2EC527|nr:bifunctional nuclease family protein [Ruania halotolerans]UFU08370.1 bifunctional nuclease family protein [Ruania halotolerans]
MRLLGVRVRLNAPDHEVLVILDEDSGERSLPIVIGPHEAVAIATVQAGMPMPRPGTHDLLVACVDAAGSKIRQVEITELREGTFVAEVVLENGARVDSRASDAIAVALRARVEVWCADAVLDDAAVVLDVDEDDREHVHLAGTLADEEADARVAEFREFLDTIDPEDFSDQDGAES